MTASAARAPDFHDGPLLWLCALISLFVLGLLGYAMVRFRRGANPTPSRTSHNTTIEVIWTLVPVLILVGIAIPSIRLLRHQYSPPQADVTVKVIGNQWSLDLPISGQWRVRGGLEHAEGAGRREAGDRFRTDADGPSCSRRTGGW